MKVLNESFPLLNEGTIESSGFAVLIKTYYKLESLIVFDAVL